MSDFISKLVIDLFEERDVLKADVVRLTLKVAELYKGTEEQRQRIKRLEEAGDALYENSDPTRWDSLQAANRKLDEQEAWRKAKEAKP